MKRKIVVNKKILIPAVLILFFCIIGSVTYAYFTAGVEGNSEAKNAVADTGTMSLVYDGTSAVSLEGAMPGAYHEIKFSVKNTGTLTTSYSLDIVDVINTFAVKEDLVYEVISTNNGGNITQRVVPSENGTLIPVIYIDPNVTQEYTLTLHFKETGSNQNSNQGKIFSGLIQINTESNSSTLGQRLLLDNLILNKNVNFSQGVPGGVTDYEEVIEEQTFTTEHSSSKAGNIYMSSTYDLDEATGIYYLKDLKPLSYDASSIEKYTCGLPINIDNCTTLYKIKEVDVSSETNNYMTKADVYTSKSTANQESGLFKTIDNDGETYYFRGKVTNNYVALGTHKSNIGAFVVGVNSPNQASTSLYTADTQDDAISMCQTMNSNYFKYDTVEDCIADIKDESVKVGDAIIWRIVRINGDKSIRLISELSIGQYVFNNQSNNIKYTGYTYDNSEPNVQDGTPSAMKTTLENWYAENLTQLDHMISQTTFCNNTNSGSNSQLFDGALNLETNKPSLICPTTSENYGGVYKLKIGLITADELVYAGLNYNTPYAQKNNYLLSTGKITWTMTPRWYSSINNQMYLMGSILGNIIGENSNRQFTDTRPVINLKSDVNLSGGDGSKEKPFIVY